MQIVVDIFSKMGEKGSVMKNQTHQILAAVALAALACTGSASANLIVAIDNTGANDPVNVENPRAWNFGITQTGADYFSANGISFDSALFDAKVHNDTAAPIVFSVYSGLGGDVNGNSLLASVSVPASEFNQQYLGGSGNLFTFAPQTFTRGYYSATLTSTAPDQATQDYFLKQGKLVLMNADQTPLDSSYWLQDQGTGHATSTFDGSGSLGGGGSNGGGGVAAVPETSTWVMGFLALGAVGFMARRNAKFSV
jgi:hypothetical protein